jgi:hypothetical protein
MDKTYNIDIWYLRPGDFIRYNLVDYTVIRFVENDDDFFVLMYNHYTKSFELISEDKLNFKFRILYSISEEEKIKTLFTPAVIEVFEILFKKFKDIIDFSDSDLETFCKDFEFELKNKNISLKEKIEEINKKYNKK